VEQVEVARRWLGERAEDHVEGPRSTVAWHGAAQHVVRSITSRFELIL
jgi:hypothetical protein